MKTAFAVVETPLKRRVAISPRSAGWTLYDPAPLAEELGVAVADADQALERCGFYKATRIREEVIAWKERVRKEERELQARLNELNAERRQAQLRLSQVREQLQNLRNLLRLPREKEPQ